MTTAPDPASTPDPLPIADPAATPDIPTTPEPVAVPDVSPTAGAAATWTTSDWLGKVIVDRDGHKIGKLHDVYVDVETDVPQFGTRQGGLPRPPPHLRSAGRCRRRP